LVSRTASGEHELERAAEADAARQGWHGSARGSASATAMHSPPTSESAAMGTTTASHSSLPTALARFVAARALVVVPLLCACVRAATGATTPPADEHAATAADVADGPEPADVATPAPVDAPSTPPPTSPSPEQRGLVAPEPDAALAALPTDARLPDRTAWQAAYRKDCKALAASPCELTGDLDGNGVPEQIVEVRSKRSKHAGIAVLWDGGGVSIIGAGTPSRQLRTDVYVDGVELEWSAVEDDLSFLTHWKIVQRRTDGFVAHVLGDERSLPAPGATGAGIWLDGGDAAEVLYWDGGVWRRLVVGF
jgi:hypothetical protein